MIVELALTTREGPVKIVRTRPAGAKPRDPDEVQLQQPNGEVLEGSEVRDWKRWNELPDWSTWKNAFCQHQELLRGRITDSGERSVQLGALLGLEQYQELGERLKALKVGVLARPTEKRRPNREAAPARRLRPFHSLLPTRAGQCIGVLAARIADERRAGWRGRSHTV